MVKFPEVLKVRGANKEYRFGYQHADPIGPQLCRALRLNNNQKLFQKIQNVLKGIAKRYLDIDATFSDQPHAKLVLMHNEVVKKYPEIFSGEKNVKQLFFAIRFILKVHHSRRSTMLARVARNKNAEPEDEVMDLTLDDSDSEKENAHESVGLLTRASKKKFREKQNIAPFSPQQNSNRKAASTASSGPGPSRSSQANQKNGITRVHQFLSACVPPMDRFLHSFVDFGCSNEGFLRGLSDWTPEAREKLLRKVLAGPGGDPASEMELAVIQNHLERYFMDRF